MLDVYIYIYIRLGFHDVILLPLGPLGTFWDGIWRLALCVKSYTFPTPSIHDRGGAGYVMIKPYPPLKGRRLSTMITKNLIEKQYQGKPVREVLSLVLTLAKDKDQPVTLRTAINEMVILPSMTEGDLDDLKREFDRIIDEEL